MLLQSTFTCTKQWFFQYCYYRSLSMLGSVHNVTLAVRYQFIYHWYILMRGITFISNSTFSWHPDKLEECHVSRNGDCRQRRTVFIVSAIFNAGYSCTIKLLISVSLVVTSPPLHSWSKWAVGISASPQLSRIFS